MSDRIAVFNKGKIEQIGTPRQIYDQPETRFVAEFIGETNMLEGIVEKRGASGVAIRLKNGRYVEIGETDGFAPDRPVFVSVRPERLVLAQRDTEVANSNSFPVKVSDCVYQGDHLRVQLEDDEGAHYIARLDRKSPEPPRGSEIVATFAPEDCKVIGA